MNRIKLNNNTCSPQPGTICKPNRSKKENLKVIIRAYIRFNKPHADDEHDFYSKLSSFDDALEKAATARSRDGKCHDHQRRVGLARMKIFVTELKKFSQQLAETKSFEEIFNIVEMVGNSIPKIGELTIYDTAHRLGSNLGYLPNEIYLHSGTRTGAAYMGFDGKRKMIRKSELPTEFKVLNPHEIEDCLCIYKDDLRKIYSK